MNCGYQVFLQFQQFYSTTEQNLIPLIPDTENTPACVQKCFRNEQIPRNGCQYKIVSHNTQCQNTQCQNNQCHNTQCDI